MSNDENTLNLSRKGRLSAEVTYLMLKGAGYAALFVIGIWLTIEVIAGIGRLLPAESRDNPDPTPISQMMLPGDMAVDVV